MIKSFAMIFPLLSLSLWAQNIPSNDIFLANVKTENGSVNIEGVSNITNRDGYDNQPHFLPDGSLWYSSQKDGTQTDIYRYDPESKAVTKITTASDPEYSPTLMPGGKTMSTVRVELQNENTQRLWQCDLDGGNPKVLLPDVTGVGYHLWLDDKRVVLFIVGEIMTLHMAELGVSGSKPIMQRTGRGLAKIPGQNAFSAVQKPAEGAWVIKRFDASSLENSVIVETLPGAEDYVWTPEGHLWMGRSAILYRYRPGTDAYWQPIADLSSSGIAQITRLALNNDATQLAIVSVR